MMMEEVKEGEEGITARVEVKEGKDEEVSPGCGVKLQGEMRR